VIKNIGTDDATSFRTLQSSSTVDTKASVNYPTFSTTGTFEKDTYAL